MRIKHKLLFLFLFLLFSDIPILIAADHDAPNRFCLRCHGMRTLSYRDSTTNAIVSLFVDSTKFNHSNHADLNCTDCHTEKGFLQYPHSQSVKEENLYCTQCHEASEFKKFHFQQREEEFKESVHHLKFGDKFSCFSCHDPHEFKTTFNEAIPKKMVAEDNIICLSCHDAPVQLSKLTNEPYHDLITAHKWLPKPRLHWKSVRCIECHTPAMGDVYSHEILPAEKALKNCETCHNKNSILFSKLYRFRSKESRQKFGFFKTLAYNSPYVIGMTRDPFIDRLSVLIFLLMLAGILGHGIGRWLATRRKLR